MGKVCGLSNWVDDYVRDCHEHLRKENDRKCKYDELDFKNKY